MEYEKQKGLRNSSNTCGGRSDFIWPPRFWLLAFIGVIEATSPKRGGQTKLLFLLQVLLEFLDAFSTFLASVQADEVGPEISALLVPELKKKERKDLAKEQS